MRRQRYNCSRVSVRRVSLALPTPQRRASHSEACSHGPVGRFSQASLVFVKPATGRWLQKKERTR